MSASPSRAGMDGSWSNGLVAPFEQDAELGLEGDIGCINHLAAWDDHDVEPIRRLVVAKQLPCQSFGAVSDNGRAHFAGGRYAQSRMAGRVRPHKQGH